MEKPDKTAYVLRRPPFAMEGPATMTTEDLAGLWTLRFGIFGCRDDETHGGLVHVEGDRIAGGDSELIFHGHFTIEGTSLDATLQVVRQGSGTGYQGVFGAVAPVFPLKVLAEAISPDLFEGRIERRGARDIRIVMRRLDPMGDRSRIV